MDKKIFCFYKDNKGIWKSATQDMFNNASVELQAFPCLDCSGKVIYTEVIVHRSAEDLWEKFRFYLKYNKKEYGIIWANINGNGTSIAFGSGLSCEELNKQAKCQVGKSASKQFNSKKTMTQGPNILKQIENYLFSQGIKNKFAVNNTYVVPVLQDAKKNRVNLCINQDEQLYALTFTEDYATYNKPKYLNKIDAIKTIISHYPELSNKFYWSKTEDEDVDVDVNTIYVNIYIILDKDKQYSCEELNKQETNINNNCEKTNTFVNKNQKASPHIENKTVKGSDIIINLQNIIEKAFKEFDKENELEDKLAIANMKRPRGAKMTPTERVYSFSYTSEGLSDYEGEYGLTSIEDTELHNRILKELTKYPELENKYEFEDFSDGEGSWSDTTNWFKVVIDKDKDYIKDEENYLKVYK